jgi:hypothetical protein
MNEMQHGKARMRIRAKKDMKEGSEYHTFSYPRFRVLGVCVMLSFYGA